jgi:hypothetical protein
MVGFCIRVDYNPTTTEIDSVIFTKSAPSTLTQITTYLFKIDAELYSVDNEAHIPTMNSQ